MGYRENVLSWLQTDFGRVKVGQSNQNRPSRMNPSQSIVNERNAPRITNYFERTSKPPHKSQEEWENIQARMIRELPVRVLEATSF
ncbi:uncharacterized protein N7483_005768 [Penicillium malachiteum]|uniref:uncharacterized protein n=1 Tax=Penicillium malachiteum TaxID=1324776 RepID=UPI002547E67E|nr:uncharacterized protein N7483_005768 [Penicillium malachiteum]KAJ5731260.1 hypothetical protein N7483_005768 [Penicillium malachiteum]